MLSYRLGTVNDFHWGFKPVLSYSKPHTFSTFFGEEKEFLQPGHTFQQQKPASLTSSLHIYANITGKRIFNLIFFADFTF